MKSILNILTLVGASLLMTSCFDKSAPNYQLFPNMYEPVSYETYGESNAFNSPTGEKGRVSQIPPAGTIKQGFVPYEIPNTPEGYALSKTLGSDLTPDKIEKVKLLNEMALNRGQKLSQMALAWVLKDPRITSVIIGASKVSHIEDAVGIQDNLDFTSEELTKIEAILKN